VFREKEVPLHRFFEHIEEYMFSCDGELSAFLVIKKLNLE